MYQINTNISAEAKLADIIIAYPDVLSALEHFNIPLGVGDKTVKEIAEQYNIKPNVFEVVLKIYGKETPVNELTEHEIIDLLGFLKYSHDNFKHIKIPELNNLIKAFSKEIPTEHGKILTAFFDNYIKEVDSHFLYEDETVFPYVSNIISNKNTNNFNIIEFEKNHTDIEQKLLDLKNILIKYLPSEVISQNRRRIINKLMSLEKDLEYHTQLEDHVLVPLVKIIETNLKRN